MSTNPPGRMSLQVHPGHHRSSLMTRRGLLGAGAGLSAAFASAWASPIIAAPVDVSIGAARAQDDIETNVELVLPFDPFGQPLTLDPHRSINWGPFWVLFPHVWSGLLAFDENGGVIADLAESVAPNDDATVWTATLRDNLAFASGNPLAAQQFVDSWVRALDPTSPSPMTNFMEDVAGVNEYIAGDASPEELGFAVVDDRTIEITLQTSNSSFPAALATFVWAPIDLAVINDEAVDDPFLADAGAGRWRFTEFVDGDRLVMEQNGQYHGEQSASVNRVVWQISTGPNAQQSTIDAFRSGAVAVADVPLSLLADVSADDALADNLVTLESQSSTVAIGLDYLQAPFDDVRVRQAVAASIDREAWATQIWNDGFVSARSFVPPSVTLTSGYQPATLPAYDPARGAQLLGEAASDPVEDAVDIVYFQPATDSSADKERNLTLLGQIEAATGLIIRHDTSLTAEQIAARQVDNGGRQFDLVWWWTVTDTPALLDTAARPDSPGMNGWFNWSADLEGVGAGDPGGSAEMFTSLVDDARAETDPDARNALYQQAEQILLDDAVLIPLGHWVQRFLQQPWLQGTRQGPWSGSIPVRIDADVVVRGR